MRQLQITISCRAPCGSGSRRNESIPHLQESWALGKRLPKQRGEDLSEDYSSEEFLRELAWRCKLELGKIWFVLILVAIGSYWLTCMVGKLLLVGGAVCAVWSRRVEFLIGVIDTVMTH